MIQDLIITVLLIGNLLTLTGIATICFGVFLFWLLIGAA
jgi:hypothetical protein